MPRPAHARRRIRRTASAVPNVVDAQGSFDQPGPIAIRVISDILHCGDDQGGVTVASGLAPALQTVRQDLSKLRFGWS